MRAGARVALVLLLLAGCDRRTGGAPAVADAPPRPVAADASDRPRPLAVEWPGPRRFQVAGQPGLEGEVFLVDGSYKVHLRGFGDGASWEVAGKSGRLGFIGIIDVEDLAAAMADLPLAGVEEARLGGGATLVVVPAEGGRVEVPLPPVPVGAGAVHDLFARAKDGPLRFPGEAAGGGPLRSILLGGRFATKLEVFGSGAARLRDVDGVALRKHLPPRKTKRCRGVRDLAGNVLPELALRLRDAEVVVYDRRSGAEAHRRVFPAGEECPRFPLRGPEADSFAPDEPIREWLASLAGP